MALPYSDLNVLFPDVTNVDVSVAEKGQVEFEILRQFGFAIEVNSELNKDFYKINIDCNQSSGAVYKGGADASANLLFEAMKTTTVGYLNDASGNETVEHGAWSLSQLNGTAVGSTNVGEQILKGILNPMLTDTWGDEAIANPTEIYDSNDVTTYNASGSTLNHKLATGLAATINGADAAAHDEVITHLLDQVRDASNSIANYLDAARSMQLFDDNVNDLSKNAVSAYADQVFWMKVYLDVAFNGTPEGVTDYEQSGITDGPLDDDDDEAMSGDDRANLVKKTASSDSTVMSALQPKFLDAFKGHIKHTSDGGATESITHFGSTGVNSTNHNISDDAVVSEVRVPILLKFTVTQ